MITRCPPDALVADRIRELMARPCKSVSHRRPRQLSPVPLDARADKPSLVKELHVCGKEIPINSVNARHDRRKVRIRPHRKVLQRENNSPNQINVTLHIPPFTVMTKAYPFSANRSYQPAFNVPCNKP